MDCSTRQDRKENVDLGVRASRGALSSTEVNSTKVRIQVLGRVTFLVVTLISFFHFKESQSGRYG